jgi:hypothetical protein
VISWKLKLRESNMALNALREALSQTGLRAFHHESPFKAEAEAALAGFRAFRDDLERQVRRGDLTVKVAREKATAAAAQLRDELARKSAGYSPAPRSFLDRLIEAGKARQKAREAMSIEGLQRETNRLLRQTLLEQQLVNRASEFEGQTFLRPMTGGPPSPTLNSLLAFHESASLAGDEPAMEWARRQLEAMRGRVLADSDRRRIDRACDRPDRISPTIVAAYVEAMRERSAEEMEIFVDQALTEHDASACAATFLLARQAPEGLGARWVRSVLNSLDEFPDAALTTLRAWESDTRRAEAEAAQAQANYAVTVAEAEARLTGLEPPTETELERQARLESRPAAAPGEPIGLAGERRGLTVEEFEALWDAEPE